MPFNFFQKSVLILLAWFKFLQQINIKLKVLNKIQMKTFSFNALFCLTFYSFFGDSVWFLPKSCLTLILTISERTNMCAKPKQRDIWTEKNFCEYLKAGRVESNNSRWLQVIPPQFSYSKSEYILLKYFIKYYR